MYRGNKYKQYIYNNTKAFLSAVVRFKYLLSFRFQSLSVSPQKSLTGRILSWLAAVHFTHMNRQQCTRTHTHTRTYGMGLWTSGLAYLSLSHTHNNAPPPPSTQLPLETGRQHTHCPVTYSGRPTCTITSRCVTSRVARTCWCPQTHSSSPSSVAALSVCLCVSSTRSSFSSLIRNLENLQDLFWFSAHDWK